MGQRLGGFLSNDNAFTRLMSRIWILVCTNILFCFSTVLIIPMGAGFAALHYTTLKVLRGDRFLSPAKTFWKGFKMNFKQATLSWLVILGLAVFLYLDWYWCGQLGGFFLSFRYIFIIFAVILLIFGLYLYPTMAAFEAKVGDLLKDSFYFAMKKPLYLIVILFFTVFPLYLTYTDPQYMPLYGFIWVSCGFGLIVLLTDTLLLREFNPFLPKVDENGIIIEEEEETEEDAEGADLKEEAAADAASGADSGGKAGKKQKK